MKTSAILEDAFIRVLDPLHRSKDRLAVNSMDMTIHPLSETAERFNTIGSLLLTLSNHKEDSTLDFFKSPTQRLFASDAYSYLTKAANNLGFKTVSGLDEFGTEDQFQQMWHEALTSALLVEEADSHALVNSR